MNAKERKKERQVMRPPVSSAASSPGDSKQQGQTVIPRLLHVQEFLQARESEVKTMEKALRNATEFSGAARVFQTLPRHMRRRAASHNVKRLPARLRGLGIAERERDGLSLSDKSKTLKKAKKRQRSRKSRAALEHRATKNPDRVWLPTHLWHAKRMHMENLWGFRLPMHPNDKAARAGYRASKNTCIMEDVSYYRVFELRGQTQKDILDCLKSVVDPLESLPVLSGPLYSQGTRQGRVHFYETNSFPKAYLGPATFLWKSCASSDAEIEYALWLWIHPSAFVTVAAQIEMAQKSLQQTSVTLSKLESEDSLARFHLTGPRSHAILQHVLSIAPPSKSVAEASAHKLWTDLASLSTPASLSPGVVLGLLIQDPRLSFPKKMEPRNTQSTPASINIPDPWPTTVAYSSLWDPAVRASLKTTKVREGTLNNRRSKLPVPGMPLEYTEADSLIPILLIQRGLFSGQKKSKIVFESQEFTSGWDIILPSIWAKEVWKSLVFAGARVGGLRESRVLSYESGIPAFPYDFPETPAFKSWSDKIEKEDRDAFDKHPLNKRPNFDKLGIAFPFASPFSVLSPSLTLIRGQSVVTLLKNWLFKGDLGSAKDFYQLCVDSNLPNYDVTGSCLVRIRLKVLRRGAPKDRAIIYQASTAEYEYWTNNLKKSSTDIVDDDDAGALGRYPPSSAIVGYVTTGNFSFQNGYGTAIGTVSLQGLIDIFSIASKEERGPLSFILVRNLEGRLCRPAMFEICE